jgi:hypothetical protein
MPIRNCRNLCSGKQFSNFNRRKYLELKYCAICHRWVKHDGLFCPCCNVQLRTRSLRTNRETRSKLLAKKLLTTDKLNKKNEV